MIKPRRKRRRGIYLLPTLFTVGNLFCGFSAIIQSMDGHLTSAAILIVVAGVLDGLDGRIARLTNTTSEFGFEFDSLADLVSFGLAPAVLAYAWVLKPFERVGWLVGFIFVVCAAMRLARFNLRNTVQEKRHFAGLPSPAAAGIFSSLMLTFPNAFNEGTAVAAPIAIVIFLALLMVSRVRYPAFKDLGLSDRKSYFVVLPVAVSIVAIVLFREWALLGMGVVYLLSAPVSGLWSWRRRSRRESQATSAEESVGDGTPVR
ncbi:MAG: CDP-diacylglycerol--serine O-phosphatidyltransferase [Acidobacteriota bacterium]|nr:CDP-diacylglycerol--serine O-phosphatidyltransferase [Acidobacteriota bacterium]MDH3784568.1 CDP-diacylglycerol--serine O-phosphatidyltransferase [Acidobacteriota bacterium]